MKLCFGQSGVRRSNACNSQVILLKESPFSHFFSLYSNKLESADMALGPASAMDKKHPLAVSTRVPVRAVSLTENDLNSSYFHYSKDGTKPYNSRYIGKKLIHYHNGYFKTLKHNSLEKPPLGSTA